MSYEKTIVNKPWGYEYLAYENEHVALWLLHIGHNQKTSTHCHPNKTTGLTVLSGEVEVSFLNDKNILSAGKKIMIRKGLFHSTRATSKNGATIFEIETPVDKHDLVRLYDSYGREGKPYEDETHEVPKLEKCLWLEEPLPSETKTYVYENCKLVLTSVNSVSFFQEQGIATNFMFLRGGLMTDYGVRVAGPGDIVSSDVMKRLVGAFGVIDKDTIVLTLQEND